METWETVFVCTTLGLIVVIAIAKVIFVLRFGDDGTPEGCSYDMMFTKFGK